MSVTESMILVQGYPPTTRDRWNGRVAVIYMDRFWTKVRKGDACWEWQASLDHNGYGLFRFEGAVRPAHVVSFILENGNEPEGYVCHDCDNKRCVRPSHLFDGSQLENMADMKRKGRQARGVGNAMSVLDPATVRSMRVKHFGDGRSMAVVCREHGISYSAGRYAILGITWGHV